ncbi:MAG TPA: rhamnan synthesis F family protein [Nocardioides sp.]|nr:rhamnan synthesis F family protein [Nocardioides sp.]
MRSDLPPALEEQLAGRRASVDDFRTRWAAFTRRWRRAAGEGPEAAAALVEEVLRVGLPETGSPGGGEPAEPGGPPERTSVAAARAVVAASGYLDADEYVVRHRLRHGTDPYRHHVETGWRLLQNPSPRFDLWSYWVDHLDPTTEGADPLLHWLVVGRHLGWAPVPPPPPQRPATTPVTAPRRVCLYAAYDSDGIVDDYVVTYLRELSRHADVFYLADGVLEPGELDKLADVTRGAWSIPHGGYDFGSFSVLARDLVGWDVVDTYDELLLANDSCFLVRPLDEVFATMDARPGDWWSLQATSMEHDENYFRDDAPIPLEEAKRRFLGARHFSDVRYLHLSSYFLAFRRPVVEDAGFRWRLDTVVPQEAKGLVVHKYEVGISRYLTDAGFDFDTWLPELQPFHPLYSRHVFDLIGRGFPLAKRNFLGENPRRAPDVGRWRERLHDLAPEARTQEMAANIARVTDPARVHDAYDVTQDPATGRRTVRTSALAGHPFRRMDRETPSFAHWWAFAAGPSGRLDPGVRAVFDQVRDDPSLHKVVLSRTRPLLDDVSGTRVTVVPIATLEGQEAVVRCGVLVVADPLDAALPHAPLPARHRIVHVGTSLAAAEPAPALDGIDAVAVVSARDADRRRVATPTLGPDDVWLTGLPRHDLLLPGARLPHDLARAEAELRDRLAGRPLVLLTATGRAAYGPADVARLGDWARDAGVLVGVREPRPDAPDGLTRLLAPLAPLGLSDRGVVSEAVVLRVASAVVADSPAGVSDALAAGHALVVHRAGDSVDDLLARLTSLATTGWSPVTGAVPADGTVALDGGAARRFVQHVRERELDRQVSQAR